MNVEAMVRSLESAMLHTIDWCRKSNSLTEPDLLFEPLMDKLAAMLRDVVPNPSQCIDSARKRANAEAQADQLAAAADAKAAAKMAKKEAAKSQPAEAAAAPEAETESDDDPAKPAIYRISGKIGVPIANIHKICI